MAPSRCWQGIDTIAGDVTVVGASAIFNPDNDLQFNVTYTAQITNVVADLAGNTLLETRTWTFMTATDVMPPRVILTGPAAGASSVRRDTTITGGGGGGGGGHVQRGHGLRLGHRELQR
jgi:hypothetical protein